MGAIKTVYFDEKTRVSVSKFQIIRENGYVREMKLVEPRIDEPTPWFLKSQKGKYIVSGIELKPIFVDNETIKEFENEDKFKEISGETIPIYLPLLTPDTEFKESFEYEYGLFLDRLEKINPKGAFGLPFHPERQDISELEELVGLNPSIMVIRFPRLDKIKPETLIDKILEIRETLPSNIALYVPKTGIIGFNTLLIALGVDIIDDAAPYLSALEHFSYHDHFLQPSVKSMQEILEENLEETWRDFSGLRESVSRNIIWQRLYREMHVSPAFATYVKILNKRRLSYSKFRFDHTNPIYFTGDESLAHPEVRAYQQRLVERYSYPKQKPILLLVPCSAKKPYSFSRSHRLFFGAVKRALGSRRRLVETWSLTSPLGVVPYELETIHPARSYDIPVSGDWSLEEVKETAEILRKMLLKIPKGTKIIVHVSEGYRGMIEAVENEFDLLVSWIGTKPTSKEAILRLEETLKSIQLEDNYFFNEKTRHQEWIDTILAQIHWNHGNGFELPMDHLRFHGRSPKPIAVQRKGEHYLTWTENRGLVRLFPPAIVESNKQTVSWVRFEGDKISGSSVFAPGISEVSEAIAPGDEVIIFDKEGQQALAVGNAIMSGLSMKKVSNGAAVKVRKRIGGESP